MTAQYLGTLNRLATGISHNADHLGFPGQAQSDFPVIGDDDLLLISRTKPKTPGHQDPGAVLKAFQIEASGLGAKTVLDRFASGVGKDVVLRRSGDDLKARHRVALIIEHLTGNGLTFREDHHQTPTPRLHIGGHRAPNRRWIEQTLPQTGLCRSHITAFEGGGLQVALPLAQSAEEELALSPHLDLAHDRFVVEAHEIGFLAQAHHGPTCRRPLGPGHRSLDGLASVHLQQEARTVLTLPHLAQGNAQFQVAIGAGQQHQVPRWHAHQLKSPVSRLDLLIDFLVHEGVALVGLLHSQCHHRCMRDQFPLKVLDLARKGRPTTKVDHHQCHLAGFGLDAFDLPIGKIWMACLYQEFLAGIHPADLEVHITGTSSRSRPSATPIAILTQLHCDLFVKLQIAGGGPRSNHLHIKTTTKTWLQQQICGVF